MVGRAKRSVKVLLVDEPLHRLRKSADLPSWPSCTRYIYTGQLTRIPDGEFYGFLISVARRAEIAIAIIKSQSSAVRDERQAGKVDTLKQSHHNFTWKTTLYRPEATDSIPWQLGSGCCSVQSRKILRTRRISSFHTLGSSVDSDRRVGATRLSGWYCRSPVRFLVKQR